MGISVKSNGWPDVKGFGSLILFSKMNKREWSQVKVSTNFVRYSGKLRSLMIVVTNFSYILLKAPNMCYVGSMVNFIRRIQPVHFM